MVTDTLYLLRGANGLHTRGQAVALANIDEVIELIKSSPTVQKLERGDSKNMASRRSQGPLGGSWAGCIEAGWFVG